MRTNSFYSHDNTTLTEVKREGRQRKPMSVCMPSLIHTGKKLRHAHLSHEVVKLKLLFNVSELEYSIIFYTYIVVVNISASLQLRVSEAHQVFFY